MRRSRLPLFALSLFLFGAMAAHAELLSTGEDPDHRQEIDDHVALTGGCEVLWFGGSSSGEIARLAGLGLTVTPTANPADLFIGNLLGYDVLVVSYTGAGVIGGAQTDIQMFVDLGHGLLVHQPNFVGTTDFTPTGLDVTLADPFWCNSGGPFDATIVDGSHPVTTGCTDADLSGDFDLVDSVGPGYTVLAVNAVCGDPALAAGTSGAGRVVFETGNASPISGDPGSDVYWTKVFGWLCTPGPIGTEPASWGRIKAGYRE